MVVDLGAAPADRGPTAKRADPLSYLGACPDETRRTRSAPSAVVPGAG
jgi:hypothetical protein